MTKLIDWVMMTNTFVWVVYWDEEDEYSDPIWEGFVRNTPSWVLKEYEITKPSIANDWEPISFRDSLGKERNNRPGFVIITKAKY